MFIYDADYTKTYKNAELYEINHSNRGSLKGDTSIGGRKKRSVVHQKSTLNKENSNYLQQLGFKLVKNRKNHA
jgi:hypothetical protein